MSGRSCRNRDGGLIDRTRSLSFSLNGRTYAGYAGDTLASALLANGVRLLGRSFKYHRPRGLMTAGAEEPSGLLQLSEGAATEPNIRPTQVDLFDGLVASSQNCWPSVDFDAGALIGAVSGILPAGFYYKTFMWPARAWPTYERYIRRAAGMGRAATEPDPSRYDHRHVHCDVLVVGGGAAGLAAAMTAAAGGARVIVADEDSLLGGALLGEGELLNGQPGHRWAEESERWLRNADDVTCLSRSTVLGYFDDNLLYINQRLSDGPAAAADGPRQRLWKIRARHVILATGAIERPLVFGNNDRPGVMLASAARAYLNRFAVRPGRRAVVFATNDGGYRTALDLIEGGVDVSAVVDARTSADGDWVEAVRGHGVRVLNGHAVMRAVGRRAVSAVDVGRLESGGHCPSVAQRLPCDLLCVSGGWNPTAHLFSQSRGHLRFDDGLSAFVPGEPAQAVSCCGSLTGIAATVDCIASGIEVAEAVIGSLGFTPGERPPMPRQGEKVGWQGGSLWAVHTPDHRAKAFVDFQNDVAVSDVGLAAREGYSSVEHLKRYTTLGMGTDQGKTSNVNGLAILARILDKDIPRVGTTTFRPPYTPITFGALAGPEHGNLLRPTWVTPMHVCHERAGAHFVSAGLWRRAWCYPQADETARQAIEREARMVRDGVGIVDISTLGRIDVQGRDAAEFLDRIYVNGAAGLKLDRVRYVVMLRDDGIVYDDGTITRLADNHFHVTTTTAHAGPVLSLFERLAQVDWPELDVYFTSVTDAYAGIALSGPRAREVLQALRPEGGDISAAGMPFARARNMRLADVPALVSRISYSGELAFELAVGAGDGTRVWNALLEAGRPWNIAPYGTEAMTVLRIEKGHCVIGAEIDGRTSPDDLGLAGLLREGADYLGRPMLGRPALVERGREQLVGLVSDDDGVPIPSGGQLVSDTEVVPPCRIEGHVTSACYSPALNRHIALALLGAGRSRHGESLTVLAPLQDARVKVSVQPHVFFDPKGERLHA